MACTLGPGDGATRIERWQRLAASAVASARLVGHQLEVRYQPGPDVPEELEALAAPEAQSSVTDQTTNWQATIRCYGLLATVGQPTT